MNILIANWTWYPSGGDWTYIDSICKIYESHGHKIVPFSVKNENNFPTYFDKYFLNSIDYRKFYHDFNFRSGIEMVFKSIYSIEAKKKLKLILSEIKVDVAQLNNISNYHTPSIIPVLKAANVPVFWRILDYRLICPNTTLYVNGHVCEACYKHKYYNCILKKCKKNSFLASSLLAIENYVYFLTPFYKKVDKFLFQSEFTRDMFVKFGFDIKKCQIIENPYDCSVFQPNYNGKNYILYFGRIEKEKGIYTLLNAMKLLPSCQLKVIGNGSEFNNCVSFCESQSIINVEFLGPKWGNELEQVLTDCEFVVVPSEWYEPSGYVVLQAFAFGKPVIASKMGGLNDMIINNVNGLLFNAGSVNDLVMSISNLIMDKNLIRRLGVNARQIVEDKNAPERYYSESMSLFNSFINQPL